MWKIRIEYEEKSRVTITGKQLDIPLRLATKYFNAYVAGKACTAIYQQYPKKDHEAMTLTDKIKELATEPQLLR